MLTRFLLCGTLFLIIASCGQETRSREEADSLFALLDKDVTGISFANELQDNAATNIFSYRAYYNGGGVAIGDVNNDGLNDIFLTSNQGDNKLYLNKGNWHFEDITERAGVKGTKYWSTGVTLADVNADGWLDIYVCNSGNLEGQGIENELFINRQDGTFREAAAEYNLADKGLSTHAVFFDYDLDGDLDCYVLNNSFRRIESFDLGKDIRHVKSEKGGDRLYRNDKSRFTDVTGETGIYSSDIGFGLGVSVCDINGDGYPDIYISNDFFEKDYLYVNQRNGTFRERIEEMTGHLSLSSMGSDIADINNDGYFDILTTEMVPEDDRRYKLITAFESYDNFRKKQQEGYYNQYMQNCLQLNNGNDHFSEIAFYAGVSATDWSWGALIFDMDNDGWKDIFVSNGIFKDLTNLDYIDFLSAEDNLRRVADAKHTDYREYISKMNSSPVSNYAFRNNADLTFSNQATAFGLGKPSFSNGAAYGDLDNDGDNDLVINNVNMPLFVYRNNAEKNGNHYVHLRLAGDSLNRFAVGSTVKLVMDGKPVVYYLQPDHGYQSCVAPGSIVIGTGGKTMIDSLQVIWPDGYYSMYTHLKTDSSYTFTHSKERKYDFARPHSSLLLTEATGVLFDSMPTHREDAFIDYNRERLMPQRLSAENPFVASADVNNDGLTDFYFGNAKGAPASLYIQDRSGRFRESIPGDFRQRAGIENAGAVFGDFDGDGDQDLIVTCGGNEVKQGSELLRPAYFGNDGKGNFRLDASRYLPAAVNASVIRACDFDKDGDLDLFMGGRSVPGIYGLAPPSFVLQNDGKGNFMDISANVLGTVQVGMVTDAQWADIDGNGFDDLVIAGNWMGIQIYKNNNGVFTRDSVLEKYKGWWSSLVVADVNADGRPDIIAGNLGLNGRFRASFAEPMRLFVNDFDGNGASECLVSVFKSDHKEYVFHQRKDLADQLPVFKKRFLRYADYAGKELDEVFPPEMREGAQTREITFLESAVFFNKGNGRFDCRPFPYQAQLSAVNTIQYTDVDGDGKGEIILAGNFLEFKPEAGRLDANYGQVYQTRNDSLYFIPYEKSGLLLLGAVRSSLVIEGRNKKRYLLFGRNAASLAVYAIGAGRMENQQVRRSADKSLAGHGK